MLGGNLIIMRGKNTINCIQAIIPSICAAEALKIVLNIIYKIRIVFVPLLAVAIAPLAITISVVFSYCCGIFNLKKAGLLKIYFPLVSLRAGAPQKSTNS
jgi:hypothetical protein